MADNLSVAIAWTLAWLVLYVWTAASLHAVFRKAGEEGWQAWVPVLNIVVLLRLGGFSGWWALLLLVPAVGALAIAVLVWVACSRINSAFGVGIGMTVLAILLFPVWSSVLGWGSARWLGREQLSPGPMRSGSAGASAGPDPSPAHAAADQVFGYRPTAQVPPPPTAVTGPVSAPYGSTGIRLGDIPPRPTSLPAVPGSLPPATASAPPANVTGAYFPAGEEDPDEFAHASHAVPAGPRRAVPPDSLPEHVGETREASMPRTLAAAISTNGHDPWAPPVALPAVRTPRYSPGPGDGGFSDTSAEVSAVIGAPSLGAPMSARSSVSALSQEPELPDAEGAFDETIIATRRRTPWMLHTPLGAAITVSSDVLIIGRRPSSDPQHAHAQLVPVADETRTMSKTHARLELHGDAWTITDLDSTNGVVLLGLDGAETELVSGRPEPLTESFLLGDAELRLARSPGSG